MDREILFRGKRMDNGKWVEGWYCPKKTGHYEGDRFMEEVQSIIIANMTGGGYQYAVVDPRTVCQYTGLTDKNGKQIFEGDIVSCAEYECCGYIAWNESEAGFYFQVLLEDGKYEEEQLYDYADELEVIGNIFDNPALLEGGAG